MTFENDTPTVSFPDQMMGSGVEKSNGPQLAPSQTPPKPPSRLHAVCPRHSGCYIGGPHLSIIKVNNAFMRK